MTLKITRAQENAAQSLTAARQMADAARELAALSKGDFTEEETRDALQSIADYVVPLGIKRLKWLKILTLWHLYPKAAPDNAALTALLTDTDRHQDDRLRDALELPLPPEARP